MAYSPEDHESSPQPAAPAVPVPASRLPRTVFVRGRTPHPVFWIIAVCLVLIAGNLLTRKGGLQGLSLLSPGAEAFAQPTTASGLRGVYSFSAELSKGVHGVYMVDVDTMTIWCYEYSKERGCLQLAAARSWKYDRYLENYNNCGVPPELVQKMVEDQRAYRIEETLKR